MPAGATDGTRSPGPNRLLGGATDVGKAGAKHGVDTDGSSKTAVTTLGYDVVGNKILEIDPNKNASAATDYTTKMVYDLNHRVTAVTDAAGYTSKNEYDATRMT